MAGNYHKAFTQPVTQIVDSSTGEMLRQSEEKAVLLQFSADIKGITALAEWTLKNDTELLKDIDNYGGKPVKNAKLAQYLGVKLPEELRVRAVGNSRYEHIYQDKVITEAKSWLERTKVVEGTTAKHVTRGWKRTVNPNKPTSLKPKISLAAGAVQYAKITNNPIEDGRIELALVINQKWYTLFFNFDKQRFMGAVKIALPNVRVGVSGLPVFDFTAEYEYEYVQFSGDYVIGVDVGITNYVTVSVTNVRTKKVVYSTTLSQRVHSLHNSIKATAQEVKFLSKKQDILFRAGQNAKARAIYLERYNQRKALLRKRRELAILAAQEVAEISYIYDNALVTVEDLSHIKNTMKFGRWNRGEFNSWLKHFVEQNGGRVFRVNAAYTSQNCHLCHAKGGFKDYHTFFCRECDVTIDRDVNAAANIALRLIPKTHAKSCATRRKTRKYKAFQSVQRTAKTRNSLKYPGRDRTKNSPTPKRKKMEVKNHNCSVKNDNSVQTVVTDEKTLWSLRTLKKQQDIQPSIVNTG